MRYPAFRADNLVEGMTYTINPPIIVLACPVGGLKNGNPIEGTFGVVEYTGRGDGFYNFRGKPAEHSQKYEFSILSKKLMRRKVEPVSNES